MRFWCQAATKRILAASTLLTPQTLVQSEMVIAALRAPTSLVRRVLRKARGGAFGGALDFAMTKTDSSSSFSSSSSRRHEGRAKRRLRDTSARHSLHSGDSTPQVDTDEFERDFGKREEGDEFEREEAEREEGAAAVLRNFRPHRRATQLEDLIDDLDEMARHSQRYLESVWCWKSGWWITGVCPTCGHDLESVLE